MKTKQLKKLLNFFLEEIENCKTNIEKYPNNKDYWIGKKEGLVMAACACINTIK